MRIVMVIVLPVRPRIAIVPMPGGIRIGRERSRLELHPRKRLPLLVEYLELVGEVRWWRAV
jgi:hypothetical protein